MISPFYTPLYSCHQDNVKEPPIGAARPETYGSFTKRVMMINLEVGGLLGVMR